MKMERRPNQQLDFCYYKSMMLLLDVLVGPISFQKVIQIIFIGFG